MSPEDFIAKIAEPDVTEALAQPDSERAIFHTCAALEALASSIYWLRKDAGLAIEARDTDYKRDLAGRSEAFDIVHAVAEAQKHGRLTAKTSANGQ